MSFEQFSMQSQNLPKKEVWQKGIISALFSVCHLLGLSSFSVDFKEINLSPL